MEEGDSLDSVPAVSPVAVNKDVPPESVISDPGKVCSDVVRSCDLVHSNFLCNPAVEEARTSSGNDVVSKPTDDLSEVNDRVWLSF